MDHDWLSSNDFAGEAALALGSISGIARPQAGTAVKAVQPVTLQLRRPRAQGECVGWWVRCGGRACQLPPAHTPARPTVRSALRMLEGRANKEAQEFVRRLKEMDKCMEADP